MTELDLSRIAPVWPRIVPESLVADRGEGVRLHTSDGRTFLDFTSGIGVTSTGHAHPRVVQAIQEQAARFVHGQLNITYHDPVVRLTHQLAEIVPPNLDRFFFANSGAEAVEGAVKLAKQATGRTNVIVFQGSFHGRTHLTMNMSTSKTIFRWGYQPLVSGIFVAPFPYAYRYGWEDDTTVDFCMSELEHLLTTQSAPHETAAMVVEPVQGEGGYVVPPKRFLQELRYLCDRHEILLVVDEIQSGCGRTGRWFAFEHFDIVPDAIVMAKGLGSGMPISCIAARRELWEAQAPGSHGGTYGANAVACAAASATIQVIHDERLVENAAKGGELLRAGLKELQARHPEIGDVRGLGLMIGTEFTTAAGEPWVERAEAVTRAAFDEGLLLLRCGTHGNIIRWIPALVVSSEELERALDVFAGALEAAREPAVA